MHSAAQVAREAVAGSAELGKGFMELLRGGHQAPAQSAGSAADTSLNNRQSSEPLAQRSQSLAEKLSSWLRQQPWLKQAVADDKPLQVELSLDQLDRPHATVNGAPSPELDQALAADPRWMEQFRDLALDRIEQSGSLDSNASPQTLTIQQANANTSAEHRWM